MGKRSVDSSTGLAAADENRYLNAALRMHSLGANVVAVGLVGSNPNGKAVLKSGWTEWYNSRQSEADVRDQNWQRALGFGIIQGVGDYHLLDIDHCSDIRVTEIILVHMKLTNDYQGLVKTGKGFHIHFRAEGQYPDGLPRKHSRKVEKVGFYAAKGDDFDHLELR